MILRKMVGGPFTRDRIEKALQSFLNDLVLQNPGEAPLETLALHPLRPPGSRLKTFQAPGNLSRDDPGHAAFPLRGFRFDHRDQL